jgi:hypothetical protein
MLDAMSIRKQVSFSHGEFTRYVNLGNGIDTSTEAKEVLVFMITGLAGGWKCPIAYFFTAGLSAESQSELVKHTLHEIEKHNLRVWAITMDGHPTNVAMAQTLGANLEPLEIARPWFLVRIINRYL